MENRIEINGVWYVREDSLQNIPKEDNIEIDLVEFIGAVHEDEDHCFEITILKKSDFSHYDDIDIKFTDKTKKPWEEHNIDNRDFILGVYNDNPDSMREAIKFMNESAIKKFKVIVKILREKEWL